MNILLFVSPKASEKKRLRQAVAEVIAPTHLQVYDSLATLAEDMRTPSPSQRIVILAAATPDELEGFLTLEDVLEDQRVILVLSETTAGAVQQSHRLRPRVVLHGADSVEQLPTLLSNMLKNG